jgi:outer membrane receptor protein involved in Fe transport
MLKSRALLAAVFAGSAVAVTGAAAQTPTKPITPVEVVATRVPKSTHDVAASVEVISGADLRARGVTTIKDALSLAAGVAVAPGGDAGPASAVPEFWGLREFDAFLLVVDGVPWGGALNPALSSVNMRDVDHIEILRGPAPVTYGATSFVGVISIVHNSAAEKSKTIAAQGGSYGSGGASIDMGLPLGKSWQSRLSADYDKLGFADDRTSSSKANALWRVSKNSGVYKRWLTAGVNIINQDPASPHPREGASLSTQTPLDANYNPSGAYLNENRFALSGGWDRPLLGGSWGTMASYTHSEQKMFRGFLTDISNNPDNAAGFLENIDLNDFYGDTHIIWPMKNRWQFMAGADLLSAAGDATGATFTYTAPLAAASAPTVPKPTTLDKDSENERMFLGAYGSAEWMVLPRLSIDAGVRLNSTSEKRGESNPSANNTKLSGSISALAGLWEKGENHVKAFANYRSTFKPAAFDFGLVENEGILKPETSTSYEAGLKIETMDGKAGLELSYFNMDFENLVVATIVNNQPALTNSGKTRYKGFELAGDLRLAHNIYARATFSSHDGKFVDYERDFGGTLTQLAGKRVEMSAKSLASAGVTYSPERGLFASAGINYTGDRYLNMRNTALAEAFSTIDAGVGYRFARTEIRIDARNLGDRRDPVAESEFGDAQYYRMPATSVRAGVVIHY